MRALQRTIDDLDAALKAFQWQCAEKLAATLAKDIRGATGLDGAAIASVIERLRKKRQFRAIALVADALLESRLISEAAIRHYAQALIDSGYLSAAEQLINWLATLPGVAIDHAEIHGMRGRIDKQRHINQAAARAPRASEYLVSAVRHYLAGYALDRAENYWHGINAVALLRRADDYRIEVPDPPAAADMAGDIARTLEAVRTKENGAAAWQLAALLEAYIALEKHDKAIALVPEYASSRDADAFEIASTLRQLTEVWELSEGIAPGNTLVPLLQAALLKCEGGVVTLDRQSVKATLEMAFSGGGFKTIEWFKEGLRCCDSIVKIETTVKEPKGTGWLFQSKALGLDGPDELLLMTNAHVLGPEGLRAEDALVHFQMSGATSTIESIIRTSGKDACDATIARLTALPPNMCGLELSTRPIEFNRTRPAPQRLYIIGHPGGGSLQFSLHDSVILDASDRRVHYRTPTEGGSSGSPVFDEKWTVVALHHAGRAQMGQLHTPGCTYEANEGIPMSAIREAFAQG